MSAPDRAVRSARSPRARALLALLGILGTGLLASCVAERTLRITSNPPGAEVRLEDETVGTTPLELPFIHYGTRRLTLRMPGHRTWSDRIHIAPPWYARFPVDILTEVVFPVGWKHSPGFHVDLESDASVDTGPDLRSVLERADALKRAGPEGPRRLPPIAQPAAVVTEEPGGTGVPADGGSP